MIPQLFLLFQDTGELIDKGFQITPGSASAYGALVVGMGIAIGLLWRKVSQKETDYKELAKEVVEVLAKVSIRMEDTKNDSELLKEMNITLTMIKEKLNGN